MVRRLVPKSLRGWLGQPNSRQGNNKPPTELGDRKSPEEMVKPTELARGEMITQTPTGLATLLAARGR